jgi:hypothetical protein
MRCTLLISLVFFSAVAIVFSSLSINSITVSEHASRSVPFLKDFEIIYICPVQNTVKAYTMIVLNICLFVCSVTLLDSIEN